MAARRGYPSFLNVPLLFEMAYLTPGGVELGLKIIDGGDFAQRVFRGGRRSKEESSRGEEAVGNDSQLAGIVPCANLGRVDVPPTKMQLNAVILSTRDCAELV